MTVDSSNELVCLKRPFLAHESYFVQVWHISRRGRYAYEDFTALGSREYKLIKHYKSKNGSVVLDAMKSFRIHGTATR